MPTVIAQDVEITDEALIVELDDGRTISVPLAWYPRLLLGQKSERGKWRLIGKGEGIHWPDLDEDIKVEQLLLGRPSGESQKSFTFYRDYDSSVNGNNRRARCEFTRWIEATFIPLSPKSNRCVAEGTRGLEARRPAGH